MHNFLQQKDWSLIKKSPNDETPSNVFIYAVGIKYIQVFYVPPLYVSEIFAYSYIFIVLLFYFECIRVH